MSLILFDGNNYKPVLSRNTQITRRVDMATNTTMIAMVIMTKTMTIMNKNMLYSSLSCYRVQYRIYQRVRIEYPPLFPSHIYHIARCHGALKDISTLSTSNQVVYKRIFSFVVPYYSLGGSLQHKITFGWNSVASVHWLHYLGDTAVYYEVS